jgi:hypothetical protein
MKSRLSEKWEAFFLIEKNRLKRYCLSCGHHFLFKFLHGKFANCNVKNHDLKIPLKGPITRVHFKALLGMFQTQIHEIEPVKTPPSNNAKNFFRKKGDSSSLKKVT